MNERTDSDLLREYTDQGSEAAFSELVERHLALVYSVARRVVVDEHLAQDITQATFVILAREARHLAGRRFFSSWLHRTASNQAAKLVRGEMRRRAREQQAYAMQTSTPESAPDWTRIAPLLDAALNKLAEADRTVILLRFFEKKTAREMATELKLTEEAAQKRVTRAMERLRQYLVAKGVSVSTAALGALITTEAVAAAPIGLSTSVNVAALAGASAAGGITLTTLKLIAMSKLKISVVSAMVLAGVAAPFVLQHQMVSRLRKDNISLQGQARRANELREENEKLSHQETLSTAELSELLRLRNEVGPLRRDSQDLARLRAEQVAKKRGAARTDAETPAGFLPAAIWANVGTEKPEAAIQTFLWAGKHAETNLVGDLLRWQRDGAIPASEELDKTFEQGLIAGTTRFAGSLQGYRVTGEREEGTDEVRVDVELTDEDGKTSAHKLRLVREDNQWFPVMHVWLQDRKSVRASLEVPTQFEQPN